MAITAETSIAERNKRWYQDDLTEINGPICELLENYSDISSDLVVKHVNEIRRRAFAINPYPCIGSYRFLNLTLLSHPLYGDIVSRLKTKGALYLDIACCFGQDLRQLVADGVPHENLVAVDIERPLIELGYDLFVDRSTLRSRFFVADVFEGDANGENWVGLGREGVDVINVSAFFHLFYLDDQIKAAKNIAKLVKKGGIIVGRQSGSTKPGYVPTISEGTSSYRHNVETLGLMWKEVGKETNTAWKVDGIMDMVCVDPISPVEDENSRRLLFTIERIE